LRIYAEHFRKKEIEQIATETSASVVWLDVVKGKGDGGSKK
jgi:hypothetical protein